jgi:hypothetical protein
MALSKSLFLCQTGELCIRRKLFIDVALMRVVIG